jgi:Flp pilus assembly protein TadG
MQVLRRFKADQRGATAMLFGFAALPLLGCVGAAVDYSRAAAYHSRMQLAVDATALAVVREPAGATARDIQAKGELYLANTLRGEPNTRLTGTSVTRVGNTVTVTAAASMDTVVMKALGIPTMPISAKSEAVWGSGVEKIELALVLDNTGSMADTIGGKRKIDELKSAAKDLLAKLRTLATDAESVKVSVVPFDTEVRLDASQNRYQSWLRWNQASDQAAWTGYVIDRYGSYATSDAAPKASDPKSLYPALRSSEYRKNTAMGGISTADLAAMRPLTSLASYSDYSQLVSVVDGMKPRGYTNIALGATWGLATLSRSEPFTDGAAAGTKGVKKYMIVLTDGKNTANHVDGELYNAACNNCSTGPGRAMSDSQIVDQIDTRTSAACTATKTAGVEVFTVRLLEGNVDLLKACASSGGNYFDVQNSGQLSKVFDIIFTAISGTRITS